MEKLLFTTIIKSINMIEGECKVGQIVKVTQPTNEKGKTGKYKL